MKIINAIKEINEKLDEVLIYVKAIGKIFIKALEEEEVKPDE